MEIYATLIDRGISRDELEQLDDFWLMYVYFHPRDEKGNVAVKPKRKETAAKPTGRREHWLKWGRALGLQDWYSLERWEEEKAEMNAKAEEAKAKVVTAGKGQADDSRKRSNRKGSR